ncbi:MAG: FeS cluster assembly protein SufD [Pseudomonadota bacterium]
MNAQALARPTRRDEPWRYTPPAVLDALAAVPVAEQVSIAPGGHGAIHRTISGEGIVSHEITVGAGAQGEGFFALTGAGYQRLELDVTLEQGAQWTFGCVVAAGAGQVAELVTRIRHVAPGASSSQVVRAVASGDGMVNVLGRIDVAQDAQGTDAALGIKGLLQGRQATINAKPELEIYADDVKCAHGCAIGQMDPQALFYAQQRGLPLDAARVLLMQAFAAEAFLAVADPAVREGLELAAAAALQGVS